MGKNGNNSDSGMTGLVVLASQLKAFIYVAHNITHGNLASRATVVLAVIFAVSFVIVN